MKKLALIAVLAIGTVAFVGTDVIQSSVGSVREAVRDATGPAFVLQLDLARTLGESLGLPLPADVSSVPVTLHAFAHGRAWRAGLGMDGS